MRSLNLILCVTIIVALSACSSSPGRGLVDDCNACELTKEPAMPKNGGAVAAGGVEQAQAPSQGDRVPVRARSNVNGGSGPLSADDSSTERRYQATGGNQYNGQLNYLPTGAAAGGGKGSATLAELKLGESLDACRAELAECQDPDRRAELDTKERDLLDRLTTASGEARITVHNVFNMTGAKNQNLAVSGAKSGTPTDDAANAAAFVAGAETVKDGAKEIMGEYAEGESTSSPKPAPAAPEAPSIPPAGPGGTEVK